MKTPVPHALPGFFHYYNLVGLHWFPLCTPPTTATINTHTYTHIHTQWYKCDRYRGSSCWRGVLSKFLFHTHTFLSTQGSTAAQMLMKAQCVEIGCVGGVPLGCYSFCRGAKGPPSCSWPFPCCHPDRHNVCVCQ